jgi:hypothetical protein
MIRRLTVLGACCVLLSSILWSQSDAAASSPELSVRPFGATGSTIAQVRRAVVGHPAVLARLGGVSHRLISVQAIDDARAEGSPSTRFVAQFYDYTNGRSLIVTGGLVPPSVERLWWSNDQPVPNADEYADAVAVAQEDPLLGPSIRGTKLRPYRPMPPIVTTPGSALPTHRTLAVGLLPADATARHEIIGVDMKLRRVIRYPNGAPPSAQATSDTCGPTPSSATAPPRGTPGEAEITISQNGQDLWHFYAVRPAGSSGTNGSGIELRYVDFRGKRVLTRAHVPIVNVLYMSGECGPYRDWLWEENDYTSQGTDLTAGHRRCVEPPITVSAGDDVGTFEGVSYYRRGDEVVLVSEMSAGWYRYVQEWSFSPDGTIRPRFRFGAVADSCTCKLHVHHAYWRFDFDVSSAPNHVEQFDDPSTGGNGWMTVGAEARLAREGEGRRWAVRDGTGTGYLITPGPNDGIADEFGAGDVWVLNAHPNEIDDHQPFSSLYDQVRAGIDGFVNDEPVAGADVVMWYGIHVSHQDGDGTSHEGGPDLTPISWP